MEALDAFMPWSAQYREYEEEEWEFKKRILEGEQISPTEVNRVSTNLKSTETLDIYLDVIPNPQQQSREFPVHHKYVIVKDPVRTTQ